MPLLTPQQDTAYYFDTSDPYHPKFLKSNRGILGSITDEIRAKPDGYASTSLTTTPLSNS